MLAATGDNFIIYTYDAARNKLSKAVIEGNKKTVTFYAGSFIYQYRSFANTTGSDTLQFITHEEGRARFIAAIGTSPAKYEYDYFVKDHLGNVRMVLTEELQQDIYPAVTLEGSLNTPTDAAYIEKNYYSINQTYIVNKGAATGITDYANHNGNPPVNNNPNSTTAISEKVYELNSSTNKIGLGVTLRVMAGDQINIFGKSYWFNSGGNFSNRNTLPIASLLDAFIATPIMGGKGITSGTLNTTSFADAFSTFSSNRPSDPPGQEKPWAYFNWIFFDEQFNYAGGGFDRIGSSGTVKNHNNSTIPTINVPKNGYLFVYCSNESNYNVFFDNLQVIHVRGPLLEETHYYPFGLIMSGISSKALKANYAQNKMKFNGIEHTTEFDLNTHDAFYRNADPQIGRWWQIDPKPTMAESLYSMMGNNPILNADPLGDILQVSFRGGFLGLGKRREVTYNNGTLTNKDG